MTKRSRKSKKRDNGNDPFLILPLDLKIEILLRLPAKSIARLSFVSKHWSSIIRSKDFTKLYMTRSLTQPRLLFVYNKKGSLFLESSSHEDLSSNHQRVSIAFHPDDNMETDDFSAPIRGLICHKNETKVMVGNPSTGQFITLPRVKTRRRDLFSFLGYDPVNDLYKVLCITVHRSRDLSDEHQVFTLGPKQKWRKITYFRVVKLPEDIQGLGLVNYGGKIALFRQMYNATLNVWVLRDAKKEEWSKVCQLIPLGQLFGSRDFRFMGALSTGQLIFAPLSYRSIYSAYLLISYDPKENSTKKVVINGIGERPIQLFIDHVESPMVLSNVS